MKAETRAEIFKTGLYSDGTNVPVTLVLFADFIVGEMGVFTYQKPPLSAVIVAIIIYR